MREMIDAPPDGEAPVLEQQDREAFAEAGVLEKSRSLQPGDRLPPQPLVKTLEEVAEKLGETSAVDLSPAPFTSPMQGCSSCSPPCQLVIDKSWGHIASSSVQCSL